ncbi:hypothetical protein HXA34_20360 [Salipaludibacillus agaradhaerens]|uniref:hypothetical protein n=1 Tax=Salipaludibacillus agaradhaerens TaxID=76935 RepID=UPI0021514E8A|nr:hypothetical protein [Salipaludibacillus agaradhaerens]MCR6108651.1 hypothetical protein [Salipaludibacillus agaradhaerens]MCR6120675.1 hypothetical protein [Salipaludibacillus agaradhaerens]
MPNNPVVRDLNSLEKANVLEVLNDLEVIETNGGEEAYVLVENNADNHKRLNDVGISSETINKYGDEDTFCILALAFSEGYCDFYDDGELIAFEESTEVDVQEGKSVVFYKYQNKHHLAILQTEGRLYKTELTKAQIERIKNTIT